MSCAGGVVQQQDCDYRPSVGRSACISDASGARCESLLTRMRRRRAQALRRLRRRLVLRAPHVPRFLRSRSTADDVQQRSMRSVAGASMQSRAPRRLLSGNEPRLLRRRRAHCRLHRARVRRLSADGKRRRLWMISGRARVSLLAKYARRFGVDRVLRVTPATGGCRIHGGAEHAQGLPGVAGVPLGGRA